MAKEHSTAPPVEVMAADYRLELVKKLRQDGRWLSGVPELLLEELGRFWQDVGLSRVGVLDVWEYWQLAEVARMYLRDEPNPVYARHVYDKLCRDSKDIREHLKRLHFTKDEWAKIDEAFSNLVVELRAWKQEKARE
jgi:hypothetical protein